MKASAPEGKNGAPAAEALAVPLAEGSVSGLFIAPPKPRAVYLLAHGAGAGMRHPFLASVAAELAEASVATLRFQFPYMEAKRGRPDSAPVAEATVAAALGEAERRLPKVPLFAGGKSFGGRMSSQAAAHGLLPRVRGLIFLGFPLHPPGQPSDVRGEHLSAVTVPLLFLQGTRDEFARRDLLETLAARLGTRATLHLVPDAGHSFHVPASSGRSDADVRAELVRTTAAWMEAVISG